MAYLLPGSVSGTNYVRMPSSGPAELGWFMVMLFVEGFIVLHATGYIMPNVPLNNDEIMWFFVAAVGMGLFGSALYERMQRLYFQQ